jgi:hypothetical protein
MKPKNQNFDETTTLSESEESNISFGNKLNTKL